MAILKNKIQKNFTIVDSIALRDPNLSMKERGLLCTIYSLPDGWHFSAGGLSSKTKDGVDSIKAGLRALEAAGYIKWTKERGENGRFTSVVEVMPQGTSMKDSTTRSDQLGSTTTDFPTWSEHNGSTITEKHLELNKENQAITSSNEYQSISQTDVDDYRPMIAENIKLNWLLDTAELHGDKEVEMVNEIYGLICDMVCYPHRDIEIKGARYPWEVVKSQFLKLRYQHVADILNRIVDADLNIKNMHAYLIATLYTASLTGTLEAQARLHDDYLKSLRGNPYE